MVYIYGKELSAVSSFKYLGVVLSSSGGVTDHLASILSSFRKAVNSLSTGLRSMPAFSHRFLLYLWSVLVMPVVCYGVELFVFTPEEEATILKEETAAWRQLLRLGGRAPKDCIQVLTNTITCVTELRIRRVAHLLRLVNSPADSWQHQAVCLMHMTNDTWYRHAVKDLALVCPGIRLSTGFHSYTGIPLLFSSETWTEVGDWSSAHPYLLDTDIMGRRICTLLQNGGPDRDQRYLIRILS